MDKVITSEVNSVSERLANIVTISDHGAVHSDLLQNHENLGEKALYRKKQNNFDLIAFAENVVAPTDRDNLEKFEQFFKERNQLRRKELSEKIISTK